MDKGRQIQAMASLKPKLTKVDLVFSYRNFVRKMFNKFGQTIYTHKIKSIVVILGLFAAHKTFGFYKSIRNALNPLSDLQQLGEDGDQENTNPNAEMTAEQSKALQVKKEDAKAWKLLKA